MYSTHNDTSNQEGTGSISNQNLILLHPWSALLIPGLTWTRAPSSWREVRALWCNCKVVWVLGHSLSLRIPPPVPWLPLSPTLPSSCSTPQAACRVVSVHKEPVLLVRESDPQLGHLHVNNILWNSCLSPAIPSSLNAFIASIMEDGDSCKSNAADPT